jgi:hypothetical protein
LAISLLKYYGITTIGFRTTSLAERHFLVKYIEL